MMVALGSIELFSVKEFVCGNEILF